MNRSFRALAAHFVQHKAFYLLLGVITLSKVIFLPTIAFKIDMDAWRSWGGMLVDGGFGNFYSPTAWTAYFPGYLYILWMTEVLLRVTSTTGVTIAADVWYKFPPLMFDLLTLGLIYRIFLHAHHSVRKYSLPAVAMYGFSPFTHFNALVWGQADSVLTFFTLLGVWLFTLDKGVRSGMSYGFALLIKPFALFISPAFGIWALWHRSFSQLGLAIVAAVLIFLGLCLPFFGVNAMSGILTVLDQNADVYHYNSLNTFNFWGMYGFWLPDNTPFLGEITMQQTGYSVALMLYLIIGVALLASSKRIKRLAIQLPMLFLSVALFYSVPVMFFTQMHERYWYSMFVFLVLGIWLVWKHLSRLHQIVWVAVYSFLALLHVANLYYVYSYYLYFNNAVPAEDIWFYRISEHLIPLSVAMSVGWAVLAMMIVLLPVYARRRGEHE